MVDPRQHSDSRGWIEGILRYIPGFKGYLEKDYRQESDFLLRKYMADTLEGAKPEIDEVIRKLTDRLQLDDISAAERLRSKMDYLINNMRGDVRGYSGFFDYVKVKEELLDAVYEHDLQLAKKVESTAKNIEGLPGLVDSGDTTAIQKVQAELDAVEADYKKRDEMLSGLQPA
jgi:hypothetical protein